MLNHLQTLLKHTKMKFIAALIATAAAVRDNETQYDGSMDLTMPMPELSEAA